MRPGRDPLGQAEGGVIMYRHTQPRIRSAGLAACGTALAFAGLVLSAALLALQFIGGSS